MFQLPRQANSCLRYLKVKVDIASDIHEIGKMPSDDNCVRIHDYAAESIKNAARDIRESSSTTKQLVHTLVRTGAFEEIARAIVETTIIIRDIANEVTMA
jgi:hypothetical protein